MSAAVALRRTYVHYLRVAEPVETHEGEGGAAAWRPDPLRTVASQAASGNETALKTLLMEVGGPMLRTVRKVLGSSHPSVDDVAQEAALGLIRALPSFRYESTVGHFAVRIALRTALHQRRHFGARERVGDFSDSEVDVADASPSSPLEQAISKERRRILRDLLDQLAEPVASTLALHFMVGMTVIEIAGAEGISVNTVWSRLRLGKQSLKKALARDGRLDDLLGGAR